MNEETARPEITPEYLASQGLSATFPQRFWSKVDKRGPDECWLWTGSTRPSTKKWPIGHGMIQRMEGVNWKIYAHRAAWILMRGPIPDGMHVLHTKPVDHNPRCVNPAHLYLGTIKDNAQDTLKAHNNHFQNHSFAGEKHGMAKLNQTKVDEIRQKHGTGKYFLRELADQYSVRIGTIHRIVNYQSWAVPGTRLPPRPR